MSPLVWRVLVTHQSLIPGQDLEAGLSSTASYLMNVVSLSEKEKTTHGDTLSPDWLHINRRQQDAPALCEPRNHCTITLITMQYKSQATLH